MDPTYAAIEKLYDEKTINTKQKFDKRKFQPKQNFFHPVKKKLVVAIEQAIVETNRENIYQEMYAKRYGVKS